MPSTRSTKTNPAQGSQQSTSKKHLYHAGRKRSHGLNDEAGPSIKRSKPLDNDSVDVKPELPDSPNHSSSEPPRLPAVEEERVSVSRAPSPVDPDPAPASTPKIELILKRFYYVEREIVEMATRFKLPPAKLPSLISERDTMHIESQLDSKYHRLSTAEGRMRWIVIPFSHQEELADFIHRLPTPHHFQHAWSLFTELILDGHEDSEQARRISSTMLKYGRQITAKSAVFTWESICTFHFQMMQRYCQGTCHPEDWLRNEACMKYLVRISPYPHLKPASQESQSV